MKQSKTLVEYLELRREIDTNQCWNWTGYTDTDNYGRHNGKWYRLHKKSGIHQLGYIAYVGAIPSGLMVCHTCDNPKCFNPQHLFVGTAQDNSDDMRAKGRHPGNSIARRKEDSQKFKGIGVGQYHGCTFEGEKNPNYGKKHPGLNAGQANAMYGKFGKDNPNFGRIATEETKSNISKGRLEKNLAVYQQVAADVLLGFSLPELVSKYKVHDATLRRILNRSHGIWKIGNN